MVVIVSHAWTLDADAHADAYVAKSDAFTAFLARHPGFRGRQLVRDQADPCHFINLRYFEHRSNYEELIHWDGYRERIMDLATHVEHRDPKRLFLDVVLDAMTPASTL